MSAQQTFIPTWATERVDAEKTFGGIADRSLVLDNTNHPHIAYGADHLYYAWYDGSTWHKETVDPAWGVGWYASIALDSSGNFHISYHDDINCDLKYAYYDGSRWHIETVDSNGDVGQYTSIALDGSDRPHISYYDGTNSWLKGSLKYAYYDGGIWHIETVDNEAASAWGVEGTSLDLDSSGNPHISYGQGDGFNSDSLGYAHWTGSAWITETVDSGFSVGRCSSLALDSNDRPYIAYKSNIFYANYDLMYAYRTGSAWVTETVDSDAYRVAPSIVLDASDNPRIAYHSSLRYARYIGTGWVTETISGEWASSLSLALDTAGNPHIASSSISLRYTQWTGSAWSSQTVDKGKRVGESASLALAPTAPYTPHVSYVGGGLRYATYDGSAWVTETIDSVGGGKTSLALAPTTPYTPYISYCTNDGLKYARWTDSGWVTETVDSIGCWGWGLSLALSPTAPHIPHIAYIGDGDLKYARWTGSGWVIETVDYKSDSFWTLQSASLALAPTAPYDPYISYQDTHIGDLRLAHWTGSGWVTETVGYTGNTYEPTSLALDSSGNPHIGYNEWHVLKYARWTGSTWAIETVDSKASAYTSLALDSSDRPRIGYHGGEDLNYAYYDGSRWITETVDSLGAVGLDVSLALDGGDRPRIAYHDWSNGDLKFAWRERVDVIPTIGGTLGAYGSANFEFPAGAVTDTVVLTYTVLQPSGSQPHVGVFFDVSAVYANTGQAAQIASGQTYTVVVHYDEASVPININESDLALYYWDRSSSEWVKEPTSVVDTVNNTVTATPNHFSVWAGLFEMYDIYLPLVVRNH
jgi:hypothetical protein